MAYRVSGYELAPAARHNEGMLSELGGVLSGKRLGFSQATPVLADDDGNQFVGMPTEEGVVLLPFIPGSPAKPGGGGFVPIETLQADGGPDPDYQQLARLMEGRSPQESAAWLARAASQAMLGGAPGTPVAAALSSLGLSNPMANGILGQAVSAAASAAGLGGLAGLAGNAVSGNAIGAASSLADLLTAGDWSSGIDKGAGALGNLLGATTGGFAGPLGEAPGAPADMAKYLVDPNAGKGIDAAAIGASALNQAADQLLSQWKVDDESSAAETIAQKLVTDNKEQIKEAVTNFDKFMEKINKLINGETSTAVLGAVRLTDPDVKTPDIIAKGVATILAEGLPIARITDPLASSGAMILEGAATVLSAGLATARETSKTSPPDQAIAKGAATVKVGGPPASVGPAVPPPPISPPPSSSPPAKPSAPKGNATGATSPTLTVYVDQPGEGGDRDPYEWFEDGHIVDVGHVFVCLEDGKGGVICVGEYPQTGTHAYPYIRPEVPGEVRDDSAHDWDVRQSYPLSEAQYESVRRYIEESRARPRNYDLNDFNCTDFAIDAASRAGITLPRTEGSWPGGGGRNPGDLGQDLDQRGAQRKQHA